MSVGAVNVDTHQSLGSRYSVSGFPTIKAFGWDKSSPSDYNGKTSDFMYKMMCGIFLSSGRHIDF